LKFEEFKVGQTFKSNFSINEDEFKQYISFSKIKNILHQKPELAAKEGIKGTLLPGRALLARAEGVMTQLDVFSNNIMLLYGMDGDPKWNNRNTRFLEEAYAGDELEVEYHVSDKREGTNTERYGILSIDVQIKRIRDGKLVIVSHRNLYRIKK
jgi:acyl dehydratase